MSAHRMVKLRTTRKAFQKRWMNCRGRDRSLMIRSESSMNRRKENFSERKRCNANNKNTGDFKLNSEMSWMQGSAKVKSSKILPPFGLLNRKPEPLKSGKRTRKIMKKSNRL